MNSYLNGTHFLTSNPISKYDLPKTLIYMARESQTSNWWIQSNIYIYYIYYIKYIYVIYGRRKACIIQICIHFRVKAKSCKFTCFTCLDLIFSKTDFFSNIWVSKCGSLKLQPLLQFCRLPGFS